MTLYTTSLVRWTSRVRLILCMALLAGSFLATLPPSAAASDLVTFTVDSTADSADRKPGDGICDAWLRGVQCTLRAAIMEANALAGANTIILPAGTYKLAITGAKEDESKTGDLDITSDVTLQGAGATTTVIDAAQLDRVLHIDTSDLPPSVNVVGVTVKNGSAAGGGGIYNRGTLTLENSAVVGNTASNGAGIANLTTMQVINSTVKGNFASGGYGGGIGSTGTFKLFGSTVSGNTASLGGGISLSTTSDTVLENSTISGNNATNDGGGIAHLDGTVTLKSVTLTANRADDDGDGEGNGGGIGAYEYNGPILSSISPASAKAGSPDFTLTVTGTKFTAGSVVRWNNQTLKPASWSATQLKVQVPASAMQTPGKATVRVLTSGVALTSGLSGAKIFTINP